MDIKSIYQLFLGSGMNLSTDTRKIEAGAIFLALKGENFNANEFALQALEKGASYVIADEKQFDDERIILVPDALKCLQALAAYHRQQMPARIIGIGGSNGKTTTKELMVSVLTTKYETHFTQGNLNNHIGVPLTLLKLREHHKLAVVELGTNKAGDIDELCQIVCPDFGLITNIGKEHLEGFGSIEGVARAESELFDYLIKTDGYAFVNMDDTWLANMSKRLKYFTTYSINNSQLGFVQTVPEIEFNYQNIHFHSVLPGWHNLQNIVAVICVAQHFNLSLELIKSGIQKYKPSNNRSQILRTSKNNTVMLDAYNANPSSVEMALKTIEGMPGKKWVILGDMFELGDYEAKEHQAIADLCDGIIGCEAILVGKAFAATKGNKSHKFAEKQSAAEFVEHLNIKDSMVLIKGSRGMKMEDFLTFV
jgi:UDP-N-acetylmuramoyl-tripeptide--D-alanyl-D-alanine ligase